LEQSFRFSLKKSRLISHQAAYKGKGMFIGMIVPNLFSLFLNKNETPFFDAETSKKGVSRRSVGMS
jgi:hypothetical protein